jgi:hypothetical protein
MEREQETEDLVDQVEVVLPVALAVVEVLDNLDQMVVVEFVLPGEEVEVLIVVLVLVVTQILLLPQQIDVLVHS